jgi:hypothetical protein
MRYSPAGAVAPEIDPLTHRTLDLHSQHADRELDRLGPCPTRTKIAVTGPVLPVDVNGGHDEGHDVGSRPPPRAHSHLRFALAAG